MAPIRRAIWFAAVVSVFVLGVAGSVLSMHAASTSEPTRIRAHEVVADHDAVVAVRPVADRSPLDLRSLHSKLLLLAWIGVLVVAALLVRTAGRTIDVRTRGTRRAAWTRHAFDRGPPAGSFA
ncbi:MAG: hypothetical protein ACTHN0_20065 [Aquihabitans sp.]